MRLAARSESALCALGTAATAGADDLAATPPGRAAFRAAIHWGRGGHEGGGAYRLLGRLHAALPRVPFVTGWVDRELALPLVERAPALAPESP